MSFGFGVGDFLAVGKLIFDITSCLKDIGGAKSEYQDLVIELDCLQKALSDIENLRDLGSNPIRADSIRYTVLACKRPLDDFLVRLRKYEGTLGSGSTGGSSSWKAPADKMRFRFGLADEVRNLQALISGLLVALNAMLQAHALETMQLSTESSTAGQKDIKNRLEQSSGVLQWLRSNASAQTAAVAKVQSLLEAMYKLVSGEIRTSFQSLQNVVVQTCVSTQQIYGVVLEIRTSLATRPDIRWTFLQDPTMFEDVLGHKFPVPSEYDMGMLHAIIQHRFQTGPGSAEASVGDYQILDSRNRRMVLTDNSPLRPGSSMIMSILVATPPPTVLTDKSCPMPRCGSSETTTFDGGGRTCCRCGVWFDGASKEPKSRTALWEIAKAAAIHAANQDLTKTDLNHLPPAPERESIRFLYACHLYCPVKPTRVNGMLQHLTNREKGTIRKLGAQAYRAAIKAAESSAPAAATAAATAATAAATAAIAAAATTAPVSRPCGSSSVGQGLRALTQIVTLPPPKPPMPI
ncbi:hypothetical protein RB595_004414 [Gaeumannomyces hyphopodioides]